MKKLVFFLTILGLLMAVKATVAAKDESAAKLSDRGPLTKITFIHYRESQARPSGVTKGKAATCYSYLAKGAKWKTTEDYELNLSGASLSPSFVQEVFDKSTAEWEKYGGLGIFGVGEINNFAPYKTDWVDNFNTVVFGNYPDNRVIAVTTVWGYFSGPPSTRQLVEWDMLFNNQYTWGNADDSGSAVMDLQNIATHELGHSAGMADLYNTCTLETMYGYSGFGETAKRDLNLGDQTGIKALYGY
jgi:hypothetical protein